MRFLTYYHLPDTYEKPSTSDWYYGSNNPYEICVDVGFIGGYFVPLALKTRIVIDDEIAPLSEVYVEINHHIPHPLDPTFPMHDVACTNQPDLAVGEHEVIIFKNALFRWELWRWRWIVHVDESGTIR